MTWLPPARSTLIGGVIFIIPLLIIGYVFAKALGVLRIVVGPVVEATGLKTIGGATVVTIVAVLVMVLAVYLAGLVAQTVVGQKFLQWIENSVVQLVPSFHVLEGLARSIDSSDSKVLVVLVPTDAGWALGMVFEPPQDDWYAVFLPGSPQWTSGSVSYAHVSDVKLLDVSMAALVMILARRGFGSAHVYRRLAALKAQEAGSFPAKVA